MEIQTFMLLLSVVFVVAIIGFWAGRKAQSQSKSPLESSEPADDSSLAMEIVDDSDQGIISWREIDTLPEICNLDRVANTCAINWARQLATDCLAKSMTLPGKTVEIFFDSAIQKGLDEGIYEVMSAIGGGHRLMARNPVSPKQIVGHGRFKIGNLKKIGAGVFNILSIAVAQAHLVEINKSLLNIDKGIKDLRNFLENKDCAKLEGTYNYLLQIVHFMRRLDSSDQLPVEKRSELESISSQLMEWESQIRREAEAINRQTENQRHEDTIGTGKIFSKLMEHSGALEKLVKKYQLFLQLSGLFKLISACLDPVAFRDQSISILHIEKATEDSIMAAIDQILRKSDMLDQSSLNKLVTKLQRKQDLKKRVEYIKQNFQSAQNTYDRLVNQLSQKLHNMTDSKGNVRVAIKFDKEGSPEDVRVLSDNRP